MPRNYWRPKSYRARRALEAQRSPAEPIDTLRAAAYAASEARNQENYTWVSDCGVDGMQAQIRHFERLINLVGAADKAWRAVAERDGVPYTPCVDCGWLPSYIAALEMWRAKLAGCCKGEAENCTLLGCTVHGCGPVDTTCPDCGEPLTYSGACSVPCGE